jgi:hypothetical protein
MSSVYPSETTLRIPRVGDIVLHHYFRDGALQPMAAIVTAVHEPSNPKSSISLTLFYPGRAPIAGGFDAVLFGDKPTDGQWSWRPE